MIQHQPAIYQEGLESQRRLHHSPDDAQSKTIWSPRGPQGAGVPISLTLTMATTTTTISTAIADQGELARKIRMIQAELLTLQTQLK